MKILYTNFHGGNGGGQDTYIYHLASEMSRSHLVTVASPAGSRLSDLLRRFPNVSTIDIQFKPRFHEFVPELIRLRRVVTQSSFDIVHVNGSADHRQVMLALLGCRARPGIAFTKHNTYDASSIGNFFRARLATDQTIAVSEYVYRMLERQSPYNNITVIKNGVPPPQRLAPEEIRRRRLRLFGEEGVDAIVLGSVAGTAPHKGWSNLVEALAQLPDTTRRKFRVVLAGEWPSQAQRDYIERSGIGSLIEFVGPNESVHDVLSLVDVSFVLSYHESLSYACREAMSMGCPVIATNVGGLPENIDDGIDGWIVPPKSPETIAAILRELAHKRSCIDAMGNAARLKSEREFSFRRFVEETLTVYQALARRTGVNA